MLCMTSYPQEYIDAARAKIDASLAAYGELRADADGAASDAFETVFCNNLVLALNHYFCHRGRTQEGKDGPLNEVRVLATSLMENGGALQADRTIRLEPATSVLGLSVGDPIQLDEQDFPRLSQAFFAELEAKFR